MNNPQLNNINLMTQRITDPLIQTPPLRGGSTDNIRMQRRGDTDIKPARKSLKRLNPILLASLQKNPKRNLTLTIQTVDIRRVKAQWKDPEAAERYLKRLRMPDDAIYNSQLITPDQARQLVKDRPRSKYKLETLIQGG